MHLHLTAVGLQAFTAVVLSPLACAVLCVCVQLFPLSRPDFVKEVTEASKEAPVIVLLYKDSIQDSRLLEAVMHKVSENGECFVIVDAPVCNATEAQAWLYCRPWFPLYACRSPPSTVRSSS